MADRPVDQQERATAEGVTGTVSPQRLTPGIGMAPSTRHDAVAIRGGAASLREAITLLTDEVRRSRANVVRLAQPAETSPFRSNGRATGPRRSQAWAVDALSWMQVRFVAATALIGALFAWLLLTDVGANPAGLFCDEAEIGVRTHQLITEELPSLHPRLFYAHFGYPDFGALPLYASAPTVLAFGLSDMAVRLASVIWSVAALLMLVALVRRLRWRNGEIAVVLFGCTPVFIHIARTNFGHAPSMFCICLGLYTFVRGREDGSWPWSAVSGVAFAASVYGHLSYYIAAPIIVGGLVLGELIVNRTTWRAYRSMGFTLAAFVLSWTPIVYKLLTDDQFMKRFHEKQAPGTSFFSFAHARDMLSNYPKYFSLDFLFRVGETGMPGGWNMRHSVPGAGTLTWVALPLVVAGVIAIFRTDDRTSRIIGIAALGTLVLYPVPDLITTTSDNAPYTFSVFSTLVSVALLAGLGVDWLSRLIQGRHAALWSRWVLPIGLLVIILGGAVRFHTGPYEHYPMVSTGYYGWQYGPGPAIAEFTAHRDEYDRFLLDPEFNEAYIFLDFYLADDSELRERAQIGSFFKANLGTQRRDLYAVRADKFDALMSSPDILRRYTRVIDIIRFPSGEIALYMVEVGPQNDGRPQQTPF